MAETFDFSLVAPEGEFFADKVEFVTAPGAEGEFTAMAAHAPFMTLLRPGVVRAGTAGRTVRLFVFGGFADVTPAGMTILAEEAVDLALADAAKIASELRTLAEELKGVAEPARRTALETRAARLETLQQALAA